jgi:hypothetical protein
MGCSAMTLRKAPLWALRHETGKPDILASAAPSMFFFKITFDCDLKKNCTKCTNTIFILKI